MILHRSIHHVKHGKWDELMAVEAKYDAFQKRLGWPPRKRYRAIIASYTTNTEIIEREWESFAVWEAAAAKMQADPEAPALKKEAEALIESSQYEVYWVL